LQSGQVCITFERQGKPLNSVEPYIGLIMCQRQLNNIYNYILTNFRMYPLQKRQGSSSYNTVYYIGLIQ